MSASKAGRLIAGLALVAGGAWAGWWFFAVFGASLSPGGMLMGGLMVLLPVLGVLAMRSGGPIHKQN